MKRTSSNKDDKSEHLIIDALNYYKNKDRSFRNGLVRGWDNILSIRVSKENLERAFKFYETLIDSLILCEHKIVVENNDTFIIVNQERFKVTLREKQKRIEITGRPDWDKYDYVPTGLFVFQWDYFKSKQWIDKQIKIEDQIPEIITWFETESFRIKEEKRTAKKAREQYELERKVKELREKTVVDELTKFKELQMTSLDKITKKYGTEHALLVLVCRVCSGTAGGEDVDYFLSSHHIDWDYFYHVVTRNRIRPASYQVLSKAAIPDSLLTKLRNNYKKVSFKSIEHLKELLDISKALEQHDIQVLPYKGLILSAVYSPGFHIREFSDIDFLVLLKNDGDIQRLRDFFKNRGYEPMGDIPETFTGTFRKYACEYFFEKHENGERRFHIDVHWLAYHPSFDLPKSLPNEILFQNPSVINISGKDIKVLNDDNHLITLILHHGLRESWAGLKYLLDIAQVVKYGNIDWAYQRKMSHVYQYNTVLDTGLALINELFGISTDTKQPVNTNYYYDLILSGNPRKKPFFKKQLRKILLTDRLSGKLKLLFKSVNYFFYPSKLDYDFVKLPKSLFFLYFFVKIIRYGFKR